MLKSGRLSLTRLLRQGARRSFGWLAARITLAATTLTVVVAAILSGVTVTLWRLNVPGLRLDGAYIPRHLLLPGIVLALGGVLLTYFPARRAFVSTTRRSDDALDFWDVSKYAALLLSYGLAIVIISGGITSVAVLNYSPATGNKWLILFDTAGRLGESTSQRFWLLHTAAGEYAKAEELGLQISCDPAMIQILKEAVAEKVHEKVLPADPTQPVTDQAFSSLSERLKVAVESQQNSLSEQLQEALKSVHGRVGDEVVLLSTHRTPPAGVGWPVQPGVTRSRWLSPSLPVDLTKADEARILSLTVLTDPALASVFSMTLEAPESIGWPTLQLELLDDNGNVLNDVPVPEIVPPPRHVSRPIEKDGVSFGRDGDRLTYRVHLPRLGARLRVAFSGSMWSVKDAALPALSSRGIPLSRLRIDINAPDELLSWLHERLGSAQVRPGSRPLVWKAVDPGTYEKPGGTKLAVSGSASRSSPTDPTLEIIRYDPPAGGAVNSFELRHSLGWAGSPLNQRRLELDNTLGWPTCDPTLYAAVNEPLIEAFDAATKSTIPVMFYPHADRNVVRLLLPHTPNGEHATAIAGLIQVGASLAMHAGKSPSLMYTAQIMPANIPAPPEVDAAPVEGSIFGQIFQAMFLGRLDDRPPVERANGYAREAAVGLDLAVVLALVSASIVPSIIFGGRIRDNAGKPFIYRR